MRRAGAPAELLTNTNAARQLSGDGRRQRSGENSLRFLGRAATFGEEVLRYECSWRSRSNLSHEGMGGDREEAREAVITQRGQAEIPGANQLLRSSGRDGWAGVHFSSIHFAGIGGNEGRSGRAGELDVRPSLESRAIPRPAEPQSCYGGRHQGV